MLAIIIGKTAKDHTIFDRKRNFLYYFNYMNKRPISALQIRSKFIITKTSKMVHFGS